MAQPCRGVQESLALLSIDQPAAILLHRDEDGALVVRVDLDEVFVTVSLDVSANPNRGEDCSEGFSEVGCENYNRDLEREGAS